MPRASAMDLIVGAGGFVVWFGMGIGGKCGKGNQELKIMHSDRPGD
jgi:hypothetical protein